MALNDFVVGQVFAASFCVTTEDLKNYFACARTRNILHENSELAAKEGIKGMLLPGRFILARAEGEMTRLPEFSNCVMLLYGMDGDSRWGGRQTRFLGEAYAGETFDAKYLIASKREEKSYSITRIDYEIRRKDDLILLSKGNLYRIKK